MKKIILAAIVAITLPGLAHAACFPSITLGQFGLGEWSNADRTWVISDTVGDFSNRAGSRSELAQHKNRLVLSCDTKGKALIAQAETYFQGVKDDLSEEFDAACDAGPACSAMKSLWVQSETASIDDHVAKMRTWYQGNIKRCKRHFKGVYRASKNHLCS